MFKLLKLEYTKFKNHSLILILLMLYAIFSSTIIFLGKEIKDLPDNFPSTSFLYKFPSNWEYIGFIGSMLSYFFLGLIAVFIVVNEINYKTFRQSIISGLTRKEYFLGKVYAIAAISLAATAFYFLTGMVIGLTHTSDYGISDIFDGNWVLPRFFIMCMGYMSFGLMVGFMVRRSGLALLFFLIWGFALEPAIKWIFNFKVVSHGAIRYLPINAMEDLLPLPFYRFADFLPDLDLKFDFLLPYWQATIVSIVWIFIFLIFTYRSFAKRDL